MRIVLAAAVLALLMVPAVSQVGGVNAAAGAGKASRPAEEPKVDADKAKADEKAYKDAVSRILPPEKKYDPWGNVRANGK